jgi:hypothetical protein
LERHGQTGYITPPLSVFDTSPGAVGSHHITLAGFPELFLISLTLSSFLYSELIFLAWMGGSLGSGYGVNGWEVGEFLGRFKERRDCGGR